MTDTGASKAKKALKKGNPAAKPSHPLYATMISTAIASLKERGGSSRTAILKFILANYRIVNEKKAAVHVKLAIRKMLAAKIILQIKGSFKLAKVGKPKKKRVSNKLAIKTTTMKDKKLARNPATQKCCKKSVAKNGSTSFKHKRAPKKQLKQLTAKQSSKKATVKRVEPSNTSIRTIAVTMKGQLNVLKIITGIINYRIINYGPVKKLMIFFIFDI